MSEPVRPICPTCGGDPVILSCVADGSASQISGQCELGHVWSEPPTFGDVSVSVGNVTGRVTVPSEEDQGGGESF